MRRLRVERGLAQDRLAFDAGVDRTFVSRLERKLENPSIGIVEKLAMALGVPIAALLTEPDEHEAVPQPLRAGRKPKD